MRQGAFRLRGVFAILLYLWWATGTLLAAEGAHRLADFRWVVIPDTPLKVQSLAAEELATYVGRMAGTKLDVLPVSRWDPAKPGLAFFVGEPVASKVLGTSLGPWRSEEWLLRTTTKGLVLAGDDRPGDPWSISTAAGSLLATYTLLDDILGVHWFWPGPFGEHVPSIPQAKVPALDIRRTPKLLIRSLSLGYTAYHTANSQAEDRKWLRRSRLGWVQSAVFGESWGDAFERWPGGVVPDEWRALVGGRRRAPQMCTTHPEVISRMVEYVLNGKRDIMNISPADGGGFCECNEETKSETHKRLGVPSCTSLDVPGEKTLDGFPILSDRIYTYANEIARRVQARAPGRGVGIFAYTFYNKPPVRLKALEGNVYVSFVYQSASHRDPAMGRQWLDRSLGWKSLGAKMVVREGWANHYYLDLPFLHYEQIMKNLPAAYRMGYVAAYGDFMKCFATRAPDAWVLTRMLWDPERKTTGLLDDYWTSAYGPAAAEMKAWFETYARALDQNWVHRRVFNPILEIDYGNLLNSWEILFPPAIIQAAERHLRAAERSVQPGEYADRVAFHRLGQDYTRLMLDLLATYRILNRLGIAMDSFLILDESGPDPSAGRTPARLTTVKPRRPGDPLANPEIQKILRLAYDLGEQRERLLLAHRDWSALDEGLYAFANDRNLRRWHATVKRELGILAGSALTKESLSGQGGAK